MKIFLLLLFWGLWFLNFCCRMVISPLLPIIEDELIISHALAGSILSFLSIGQTIATLLSGLFSPRIGYKRTIIVSFAILTGAVFSFKYAETYLSLTLTSLMLGLGAGLYLPSAIPLLTALFEREHWGRTISFHESAGSLSILAVPLLTVLALRLFYWRYLFFILSGTCLIILLTFWVFSPNPRIEEEKGAHLLLILGRRDFWIITILFIFAGSNILGLYNVIPLFLVKEKGIHLETANTIFGLSRFGGLFAIITGGLLVDRYGVKKILFSGLLIAGISTIGLALVHTLPLLAIMLFIQATVSVFFPVALVAISKLTHVNERSTFTGAAMGISIIVGLGVTPPILGVVADTWSFQSGILGLGVITTLSCMAVRKL
jgi:NNP family nitrate/nitrite transporter-like MFS transporter